MNVPSALSSLYFQAPSLCNLQTLKQQQPTPVSKPKANSTVTILPAPATNSVKPSSVSASSPCPAEAPANPTTSPNDGYSTPKSKPENQNHNQKHTQEMPSPSPMSSTGKRKRLDMDDDLQSFMGPTPTKRKASSDFLRKGQWTSTEERLARLLIEAFEEGSLPIYTGIRLRGYLAVQLQCDPMRVSKKLCAGTIDGKQVPKNYGQKKFKLRKKPFWDSNEAEARIAELKGLTKAMWSEARMRKPSFLTLSSTRNLNKKRGSDDDDDSVASPPSPARGRFPSSTPKSKKQKVFPIIYLNLSKLKRYSVRDDSSGSESASPSKDSDSDSEPVRLDGESLQAAYDLLTLCSPRGTSSKSKSKKKNSKKDFSKKDVPAQETCSTVDSSEDKIIKNEPSEDKPSAANSSESKPGADNVNEDIQNNDKSDEGKPSEGKSNEDKPTKVTSIEDASTKEKCPSEDTSNSEKDVSIKSEPSPSTSSV